MAVFFLCLIGFALFCIVSLILPWVNRNALRALQDEVRQLKADLLRLQEGKSGVILSQQKTTVQPAAAAITSAPQKATAQQSVFISKPVLVSSPKHASRIGFEQQFGARLPVWIGGIALALAGFFMVKYSIDNGLLTEHVRVILGLIFGFALQGAGEWARRRPALANGKRIAQALTGAGIADLYACLFAASSLYHLVPFWMGFAGMAAVTASAVILSLRHGAPIALLGLAGGFLTPALLHSGSDSAPLLFLYLYIIMAGLFATMRRQGWWWLSLVTLIAGFGWVAAWLFWFFAPGDGFWLGLFLLAISATTVTLSSSKVQLGAPVDAAPRCFGALSFLPYAMMAGTALLMGLVTLRSGYGLMEWALYGLLAAGSIVLAQRDNRLYRLAPWLTLMINAAMLALWRDGPVDTCAAVFLAFALLYGLSGYVLLWRSKISLSWAGLAAFAPVVFYLLAYLTLHGHGLFHDQMPLFQGPFVALSFWGVLALGLCLVNILATRDVMARFRGSEADRQSVLAVFTLAAVSFLSLGALADLQRDILPVFFAVEILGIAWLDMRLPIKSLRWLAVLLFAVFGLLLLPQIVLLFQLTAYSLTETKLYLQQSLPLVDWPVVQLGVPAALFVAASLLLRRRRDDGFVRCFEVAAIALFAMMGYYLTRHAFHAHENILFIKANFAERGAVTNILFVYGIVCLFVGRIFARNEVAQSGLVLCGAALFRIGYFDLFVYNPLWSAQDVGAAPFFNALTATYGLPILWSGLVLREMKVLKMAPALVKFVSAAMLVLGFTLATLTVRQYFHDGDLAHGPVGNAEIYSYSIAWVILGVCLLVAGTKRRDKTLRVASLLLMILTIGKVFLYDVSELAGLYRVFSFLGLGVSLIGLSWFYTRYVFGIADENKAQGV